MSAFKLTKSASFNGLQKVCPLLQPIASTSVILPLTWGSSFLLNPRKNPLQERLKRPNRDKRAIFGTFQLPEVSVRLLTEYPDPALSQGRQSGRPYQNSRMPLAYPKIGASEGFLGLSGPYQNSSNLKQPGEQARSIC